MKIVILTRVQGVDGWVIEVDSTTFIIDRTEDMWAKLIKKLKAKTDQEYLNDQPKKNNR